MQRIPNNDIVTIQFAASHHAVAVARELKAAGFGDREVVKGYPGTGEWTLRAKSRRDFERLSRAIPEEHKSIVILRRGFWKGTPGRKRERR